MQEYSRNERRSSPASAVDQEDQAEYRCETALANLADRPYETPDLLLCEKALRSIHDIYPAGVDAEMHKAFEYENGAFAAIFSVTNIDGAYLLPDYRRDIFSDGHRFGKLQEVVEAPLRVVIISPQPDPFVPSFLSALSDNAFTELRMNQAVAVRDLRAKREANELGSFTPVPSFLANLLIRTVRDQVNHQHEALEDLHPIQIIEPARESVPPTLIVAVEEIQSSDYETFTLTVKRFPSLSEISSNSGVVSYFVREEHTVTLSFNEEYGTVEREWKGVRALD